MMHAKTIPCAQCRGDCCTGMAVEIPTPKTRNDYLDIRWYLYHERTQVYIDHAGIWVIEMDLPCRHRDPRGGRCRIYAKRPPVCRQARPAHCEMNEDDALLRFRTVAEYDAWLAGGRRTK